MKFFLLFQAILPSMVVVVLETHFAEEEALAKSSSV